MNFQPIFAASFALTAASASHAQRFLMVADSTNDRVSLYSPADGSLVNATFIVDAGGTPYNIDLPKDAIQVGNEVWIIDQNADSLFRFDLQGAYVATVPPATGMLDNIRGGCFANNTIYVSNDGTGNGATADTVVMFDTAGNRLGQFSVAPTNSSPFDVTEYNGELLVSEFTTNNQTDRYDYAGVYLGNFHSSAGTTTIDDAEQISITANNEVLIAGFLAPVGIYRYDSTGAQIAYYNSGSTSGCRGCYELDNGNILFTDGAGLKLYDIGTAAVTTVATGTGFQYINLLDVPTGTTVYCTAGTSTNSCVPAISAAGTPSVAASSGFTLSVANLEGQKQGLFFYGISGQVAVAWGTGTSFLCVKAPTQRMTVQNSGGTTNACDGVMSEDWLAWVAAHPTGLGAPFSAGQVVDAQCWYRDPPSAKTTNLSDGIEFTLVP
jgi:hypothetical protein